MHTLLSKYTMLMYMMFAYTVKSIVFILTVNCRWVMTYFNIVYI